MMCIIQVTCNQTCIYICNTSFLCIGIEFQPTTSDKRNSKINNNNENIDISNKAGQLHQGINTRKKMQEIKTPIPSNDCASTISKTILSLLLLLALVLTHDSLLLMSSSTTPSPSRATARAQRITLCLSKVYHMEQY